MKEKKFFNWPEIFLPDKNNLFPFAVGRVRTNHFQSLSHWGVFRMAYSNTHLNIILLA